MSKPFLRFENGKISLGNKDLMVRSANLSIAPQLEPERVYGDFDLDLMGAKTEFVDFSPRGGITGKLDITFMIIDETFDVDSNLVNDINVLFDIRDGMSEESIDGNIVGRYFFNDMYLDNFSFSLAPYKIIEARASYSIYGTIHKTADKRFQKLSIDPAHGLKSFGKIEVSNTSMSAANGRPFEVSQLDYNIRVERKPHYHIRDAEHSRVATSANGAAPQRVSVEKIEASMSLEGNDIVQKLNPYGEFQSATIRPSEANRDSSASAFLYSMKGKRIASFKCEGKIMEQSVGISEGNNAKGKIAIKQIIK